MPIYLLDCLGEHCVFLLCFCGFRSFFEMLLLTTRCGVVKAQLPAVALQFHQSRFMISSDATFLPVLWENQTL